MTEESNIPQDDNRDFVPGISPGAGWQQMKVKLDAVMPVTEPISQRRVMGRKFWLLLSSLVFGLIILGIYTVTKKERFARGKNATVHKHAGAIPLSSSHPGNTDERKTSSTANSYGDKNTKRGLLSSKGITSSSQQIKKVIIKQNNSIQKEDDRKTVTTTRNPVVPTNPASSQIPFIDSTGHQQKIAEETIAYEMIFYKPTHQLSRQLPYSLQADEQAVSKRDKKDTLKERHFEGGLQLSTPMPVGQTFYYLTGPTGKNEFYRIALPSLWGSYSFNKNTLTLSLHPLQQQLLPATPFKQLYLGRSPNALSDTTVSLVKTFGIGTDLTYYRHLTKHIYAGVNIAMSSLSKGVIRWQRSGPDRNGVPYAIKHDSLYSINKSDTLWNSYINSFQIHLGAEILYNIDRWQIGLKTNLPLNKPVKSEKTGYPIQSTIYFRYKFLQK